MYAVAMSTADNIMSVHICKMKNGGLPTIFSDYINKLTHEVRQRLICRAKPVNACIVDKRRKDVESDEFI